VSTITRRLVDVTRILLPCPVAMRGAYRFCKMTADSRMYSRTSGRRGSESGGGVRLLLGLSSLQPPHRASTGMFGKKTATSAAATDSRTTMTTIKRLGKSS
jgi:hypothetical protein